MIVIIIMLGSIGGVWNRVGCITVGNWKRRPTVVRDNNDPKMVIMVATYIDYTLGLKCAFDYLLYIGCIWVCEGYGCKSVGLLSSITRSKRQIEAVKGRDIIGDTEKQAVKGNDWHCP